MKHASFAPAYAAMYPALTEIARQHGYAMAVHGSMQRDFDVACIPWIEAPSDPAIAVAAMCAEFAISQVGEPEMKLHGRLVYTLSVEFGDCFLDLSFMPLKPADATPAGEAVQMARAFDEWWKLDQEHSRQIRYGRDPFELEDALSDALRKVHALKDAALQSGEGKA